MPDREGPNSGDMGLMDRAKTRTVDPVPLANREETTVPLIGVIAQSVGNMGVCAVVALVVPLVGATSGNGNWLTWIICTVVILMVAWCISRLSQHFASSGGIYGLAAKTLGGFGGALTGWMMLLLAGVIQGAVVIGFGIYASQFLTVLGLPADRFWLAVMSGLGLLAAWVAALAGIRHSVKLMLGLEVVTIVGIAVLMVATLATHRGPIVDRAQLDLRGTSFHSVVLGVVLAVLSFGGFESATVLGREARNPTKAIPAAMLGTVVCAGVFWLFCDYVIVLGFEGSRFNLAKSSSPLSDLSRIAGIGSFRYVLNLMIALTLLGSLIAVFNSIARFMYSMARDGIGLSSWKILDEKRGVPVAAIRWLGSAWALLIGIVIVADLRPFTVIEDQGDLTGFAFMLMYSLIAIGAVAYLHHSQIIRPVDVICGVIAVGTMGYVFYESNIPFPPAFPDNLLLYIFLGTAGAVVGGYLYVMNRHPEIRGRIGSSVDEDTGRALPE